MNKSTRRHLAIISSVQQHDTARKKTPGRAATSAAHASNADGMDPQEQASEPKQVKRVPVRHAGINE